MKNVLGLRVLAAKQLLETEGKTVRTVEVRSKKGGKGNDARVIKADESEGETTVYWSAFQTEVKEP